MSNFLTKVRQKLAPTPFDLMVRKFYAEGGEATLRYEYDLSPSSIVLDLGGYKGDWAAKIWASYQCRVEVFEPVPSFADAIRNRFSEIPQITVHCLGLGAEASTETIWVEGEASSSFKADSGKGSVNIQIVDIVDWLSEAGIEQIDLIKINIEGAEYSLLERMIAADLHTKCKDIQVQFHNFFPDAEERMLKIGASLSKTHHLTYDYKFVWQNWRRSDP